MIHLLLERKEKNTISNPTQKNGFTWECFAKKILKNVSFISIHKALKIIVVLKSTLKTFCFDELHFQNMENRSPFDL